MKDTYHSFGGLLLPLFLFLLVKLLDGLFQNVRPEVTLEVGQLRRRADVVLHGLLQYILVVEDDPLDDALVQHFLIPLLETFGLGDLLLGRMAVEYVVVPLGRGAGPDVCHGVSELLGVVEITQ